MGNPGWNNQGRAEITVAALPAERVLLDVREHDEWAAGHAPDAVHLPMSELAGRLDDVPDAAPLYIICRSGGRSERVTAYLNANGWEAVNVVGGMSSWSGLGLPMTAETGTEPEVI